MLAFRDTAVSSMPSSLSCINRCNVSSHVPGARFIGQSLQVAKNKILMSSSDAHMFIDDVIMEKLEMNFIIYLNELVPDCRIPDCRIPYCRVHFAESHIADFC